MSSALFRIPYLPLVLFIAVLACGSVARSRNSDPRVTVSTGSKPSQTQQTSSGSVITTKSGNNNDDSSSHEPDVLESLDDLAGTGFELGHLATRVFNDQFDNAAGMTTAEEIQIGLQVHGMIRSREKLIQDSAMLARLESLAIPFLQSRQRKDLPIRFSIIDNEIPNAFAHAGGYIYVHTGLLTLMKDDTALQFVLGHEIAHCELRHCVKSLNVAARVGELSGPMLGQIASIAWQNIALGYSEDHEFEADDWSYRILRRGGLAHSEAILGLQKLIDAGTDHCHHDHDAKPGVPLIRHIEDHFRSHPSTQDRIDRLGRINASLP
jgi:hypothetical protein